MSGMTDHVRNAFIANGGLNPIPTNNPARYADRQRQYFDPETRRFIQDTAKYASDFMSVQVQGLSENDPTEWGTYRMRLADVVRPSSAIQRHFDDYKQFLFESAKIEYVRPGTKFVTMGNTWLVTNPANVSGASGSGICRRCNAVWNHLDAEGNILSEPLIVENERANANDSDAQNSLLISKGYFNVICQYNQETAQINTNTRMILGKGAYRVTGFSDFETEFTGDYSTVRLLSFTVRYEEPNPVIDDMENHVAGGKTFVSQSDGSDGENGPSGNEPQVAFTSVVPQSIAAYQSAEIFAAYFVNETEQSDALAWDFSGAENAAYGAKIAADGKSVTITCFGYSETPLTVTASSNGYSVSAQIVLEGI